MALAAGAAWVSMAAAQRLHAEDVQRRLVHHKGRRPREVGSSNTQGNGRTSAVVIHIGSARLVFFFSPSLMGGKQRHAQRLLSCLGAGPTARE
ncbi:hypothetical protein HaLaN_16950 [Haematococcus lacustris]|uniref:Uncharacterized protein n=1 Tax=Haematococcus lacustris TaxID=44745 RepID=A0A699ZN49_HAELA|nr:hypothetical protein HaLaN_16950 [Haematococcus lacustris]